MISTKREDKKDLQFIDQTEDLKRDNGPEIFELVQAAMRAGIEDFTTPTTDDGEGRIEWSTRRWLTMRNGKPTCFLVAYRVTNAHFEVIGPEIPLASEVGPVLQKRSA